MPKAYSYTRFSTPEQAHGDSSRRQIELAESYAAVHQLTLDNTLRLKDEGVSGFRGANVRKGALGQFMAAIDNGDVEPGSFLLVESLDRVSRQNPWDALPIFQLIINAGVTIVTLFDGKSYDLPSMRANPFRIMESLFVMVRANEESETKARRLKEAWKGKRSKIGEKPLTSIVPAWLKKEGNEIVLIPARQTVVRKIVDWALGGLGQNAIASRLNQDGTPVFGRGKFWHRSYISKILENPALVGTLVPHELSHENGKRRRLPLEPVLDYFPAVVTQEEWASLSGLAAGRKPVTRQGREIKNILAGLATCASCGGSMVRVDKGSRSLPKLVCSRAKAGAGCHYRGVHMWIVEASVRADLPDLANEYPSGDVHIDEITKEIRDLEFGLGHIVDELISHGRSEALSLARTETEKRLSETRGRLREAMIRSTSKELLHPERLFELQEAPIEDVNTVLRSLFTEARIDVTGPEDFAIEWVPR